MTTRRRGTSLSICGPSKKAQDTHRAALPWRDAPEFLQRLRQSEATSAALRPSSSPLTAVRSNEARTGATWAEIDLEARVWTIPAARMKAHRDHDVPLSDQLLSPSCARWKLRRPTAALVFVGGRGVDAQAAGKPMRNASLWMLMRRRAGSRRPPHGFRSTFRDWCGETGVDEKLAERCLAHKVSIDAENAYARSSLIARRRPIMEAWGAFVGGARDNVLPFVHWMAWKLTAAGTKPHIPGKDDSGPPKRFNPMNQRKSGYNNEHGYDNIKRVGYSLYRSRDNDRPQPHHHPPPPAARRLRATPPIEVPSGEEDAFRPTRIDRHISGASTKMNWRYE